MSVFRALRDGHLEDALARGDPVDEAEGTWTALLWALREGNPGPVKLLLGAGADPNLVLQGGGYPLQYAAIAYRRKATMLKMLLEAGARIRRGQEAGLLESVAQNRSKWILDEDDEEALLLLIEHGLRVPPSYFRHFTGEYPRAEQEAILKCPFGCWMPRKEVQANVPPRVAAQMHLLLLAHRFDPQSLVARLPRDILLQLFFWLMTFPMPSNIVYAKAHVLKAQWDREVARRDRITMQDNDRLYNGSLLEYSSADDSMEGNRIRCFCLQCEGVCGSLAYLLVCCNIFLFPICLPLTACCGCVYCRTKGPCVCPCVKRERNAHLRNYK